MKIFTKAIPALLLVLAAFFTQNVNGQSIINPNDTVYTYSSTATKGSSTNPNQPATGVIGKWVRTVRMSWNTSEWKCYVYNGMPFRVHFPHTYTTAVDGTIYPLMIFYHGAGEDGPVTDNEISMAHGGQVPFQSSIDAGTFDGYIVIPQSPFSYWDPSYEDYMKQITDYMAINNKVDLFHIIVNGLSAGGSAGWDMQFRYPQVMSAQMPMSSNNQGNSTPGNLALTKFTPIWTWQGGLDTWPDTYDAGIVNTQELTAGADYKYQIYPTLGHDTWDNAWAEPDFFPFALRSYSSNPWPLHGQSAFCPGVAITDTLGVAPGFDGYKWRYNGGIISGATTNSIIVNQLGTYDCQVERNGVWSDWSHTPVVITIRQPTVTPPITTAGLASVVIPSLSSPGVTLQVPTGYASYTWQKVGSNTTVSSANTLNVTTPGQYIVEVTQTGGCSSSFSPPFTVISANGPNAPDPASGVLATPVSQTSILLTWNQNPTPTNNETGFEIYQATKSGGPYTLVAITGPDVSKDTIPGLSAASNYFYVIRAVDATGASATSNEASVITAADTQPPSVPGALMVTGTGINSVSLGWTAATDNVGVVGYDIYVNGVKSYSVPSTQTNFTVYSLTNGQTYSFVVKARDLAGNVSNPSNQVSGQALLNGLSYNYYNGLSSTLTALPNFSTITPAFSGILPNFSLSPEIDNTNFGFVFYGYIIIPTTGKYTFETNSDDGSMLWLGALNGNGSPYAFGTTPLVNNDGAHGAQNATSAQVTLTAGIYPIAVAYWQEGGGFSLNVLWKTPSAPNSFVAIPNSAFAQTPVVNGTAPNAPSNLVATALSYKAIGLSWKDNSTNEGGFEVWRSNSPVNTGAAIIGTTGAAVTSYIDSTASASTQYFYEVRAINTYGASLFTYNYTEAEFKFNNNFNDSTGNGHTLTAIGSPAFDASNVQEGAASVKLNGTNQALTINNTPNSFLQESYFQRTIACWIKASSTTGANRVIWDIGGSTNGLSLVLNNTTLTAAIASASSRKTITSTLNNTNWNHVAVVYYGDSLMLYVNGVLTASNLALGFHSIATTTDGARIGQTNGTNALNTNGGFFGGNIDDFGVYNTALTVDAVQSLMNLSFGQSHATSQPLPAIPAAPTALTATATSAAGIGLVWTNNAVNAANVQVYRSNNNNQNYILLAVLPASASSYKDSGLFANATYFYKVNAVNPGGSSAYSNEATAVTLDIPPVIVQIANHQAQYGVTTTIAVSSTHAGSGAITLTAPGLPAFAQLTDNGNGTGKITLNPAKSDSGTYNNLVVTASDAFGGSSQTQFNLWINNNFPPTIDSIANYTMNEGDTVTIPVNGHNVNPADILTIALSGLPSTYTLTPGTNGSATLQLTPNYAAAGVFTVTATVNDNNGLSTSRSFTLTVIKKDPITRIYTRVKYQLTAPAPWNNLNGAVTTNLLDQNGNVTPVGITFNPTNWWVPFNGGANTGNNSGVYPDVVLEEYYYFSFFGGPANPTVVISGLNTNKKYDITFLASSSLNIGQDNGVTTYSIGNQTVNLEVQNNSQNTVSIDTVTPASDGTITVTMGKLNSYPPGYLNAIVIANHFDDGSVPAAPSGLQAKAAPRGVSLTWNDVAYNETSYQVYRSLHDSLSYVLLTSLPANSTSFTDTTTSGSTLYYYKVNALNQYGTGAFSNPASILSPDRIPQFTPIADVTLSNTQTVQVPVTAIDDPTDHLTLTASGLPSFASFTDNGNGTGVITLQPTTGLQGTFQNLTVTATDLSDSSSSITFNVNVVDPALAYTYINVTTPDHQAAAPWNNLSAGYIPYAGTAFPNLLSQTGAPTGYTITLTDAWQLVAESGMKRRNGSDLYPESISSSSFFASDNNNRRITITGLNPALGYNFQFFISHNTSQSTLTHFTINGQTTALNGSQNSNKTTQINGVTPDNTGTVVINCQKDTSAVYAMISAIVIESYTPGSATPFSPADLRVLDFNKTNTIGLQWQDRANNETGYEVWRAPDGGTYAKLVTLPANTTTYTDANLPANTAFDYIVRAVNGTNVSAYSNPVKGYTYASAVFVFLNRVWAPPYNFPSAPAPFNNLNWIYQSLGTVWNNFTDESGLPTNIGMVQPVEWDEVDPFGASTGNNSGLFPDVAMDQGWLDFVGDSSYVTLTGLDASKKYDISVFASCTDDGSSNASAVYRINGQAGILNAHLNTSGNLTFFGITPDQNGNVSIGVSAYDSSNSSFAILGNIVIKGYTPVYNVLSKAPSEASVTTLGAQASTFNGTVQALDDKPLTAFPNPFRQFFNLSVPAADHDNIMVTIADAAGRIVYQSQFDNLVQGDNSLRIQTSDPLPSGVYFVTVAYINKGERKLIKMIKN